AAWANWMIGQRARATPPTSNAPEIERFARLIRGICRRWPFGATCLDRSLVTVALLGRRRISVAFCIGFRRNDVDVEGHAWVEHEAFPLAETADVAAMSRQVLMWRDTKDHRCRPAWRTPIKGQATRSKGPGYLDGQ